tara:strand:- start:7590 stop:7799 length:210 start_codon:yes stop_codon:yes gene_type:complete
MSKSQCDKILDYLKSGKTLDPITSWTQFGSYRLSARIKDLRDKQIPIETIRKVHPLTGSTYGVYRLKDE